MRAAHQALKVAQPAEKTHRNAPKVQESAKSPVTDSAGDISAKICSKVPQKIQVSDIASVARDHSIPLSGINDSSSSSKSLYRGNNGGWSSVRQGGMVELGAAQPGPMAEQITGATPGTGEKIPEHAALGYIQTFFSRRETEKNKSWSGFLGHWVKRCCLKEKRKILMKTSL